MTVSHAASFSVHALSPPQRLGAGVLPVLGQVSLLAASWLVVFETFTGSTTPTPPALAGWLALLALGLFALNRLLSALTRATLLVEADRLVLDRRVDRLEIPLASVESVRCGGWPVPGVSLGLRMKSGRRFASALVLKDPLPVLEALERVRPGVGEAAGRPLIAFARARALTRPSALALVFKFVLFPLLPGTAVFQLNQRIIYGGPFAQYQTQGLGPYARSFMLYWAYLAAGLVLYACVCRVLAELVALVGAGLSPPHARGVRRFVEFTCAGLYYVGVPALLAARLLL